MQAITEELRAHGAESEEESDVPGWTPKTSKKRRKGVQPWNVQLQDSSWELKQFVGLLQRKEAVLECEQKIADLTVAAEKAAEEASRQQVELTALGKEVEERNHNWHVGEEEGFSVVKSQWEDG
ncbi:Hypothetical protein D9617_53g017730 [Elsinoe fawcettii]|nr:Hypothetical protein D9617_53g017730 [Elsinoe fawcettii]